MSLITAAYLGNIAEVQKLLESEQDPIDVNEADAYGDSALHAAAYSGKLLTVQHLIKSKANVNAKNHVGSTPLHKAVLANNLAVISELLDNGADADIKNGAQKRPEYYVQGNNIDLIQTLKGKSLVTKNLTVPRDRHGQLIGRQGRNLNSIRSATGAEIKVPKAEDSSDEIVLKGRDEEVKEAERLITEFLAKEPPPSSRQTNKGTDNIPDNWPRTKLNINKENLRFVIGPKGRTIRAITEKTGARITIPRDDEDDSGVLVAGPYEALEEAVKMIYAAIVDNSRGNRDRGNNRDNNNRGGNNNNNNNNNNNRGNNRDNNRDNNRNNNNDNRGGNRNNNRNNNN